MSRISFLYDISISPPFSDDFSVTRITTPSAMNFSPPQTFDMYLSMSKNTGICVVNHSNKIRNYCDKEMYERMRQMQTVTTNRAGEM